MAKKKATTNKKAAKTAKKAKAAAKEERKDKKKKKQPYDDDADDDDDLEGILEKMRLEWEEAHKVTEEVADGPPSRRANATLTPCPNGNHLWCIGGEYFSEDGKAYFYSDVYRYTPDKDEWRRFVSQTCPGPRSAHAVAASPAGGGKLFLFGGEFSSLRQNTFLHYRDFWCFDITTHTWDRIETKVRPSARSGHRMAIWKHFIVLFGGFYDPGLTTRYLNDLWIFDTQEYQWRQIEFKENEAHPSPRSGFSFISTPDGIVLHGGYCKEYAKGKRPVGVMLEDTWFLRLTIDAPSETKEKPKKNDLPLTAKWERRKRPSTAYAPALRSGATMACWTARNTAIMFGGVSDEDTSEETLESTFWNDLNGYQWIGKGRWMSMNLRQPKGSAKAKKAAVKEENDDDASDKPIGAPPNNYTNQDLKPDDPMLTVPLPRYNTMLAVLRNTLYIYGGIFEKGSREYTLDDFYYIHLDKMDRYVCLKKNDLIFDAPDEESSDEDDSESDSDTDSDSVQDEEDISDIDEDVPSKHKPPKETESMIDGDDETIVDVEEEVPEALPAPPEDPMSTPLPGETVALFYARTRDYWTQQAALNDESRGKELRRFGFTLASERYEEYLPTLREVEKILAAAGLDESEMRQGAMGASGKEGASQSRNRR